MRFHIAHSHTHHQRPGSLTNYRMQLTISYKGKLVRFSARLTPLGSRSNTVYEGQLVTYTAKSEDNNVAQIFLGKK